MTFADLCNLHAGRPAVVIGKGPTLDAWLAAGCPQPAGAVRIGVNQVAAVVPDVPFSVSGDAQMDMDCHLALPTQWLRAVPYQTREGVTSHGAHLPPAVILFHDPAVSHAGAACRASSRDHLRRLGWLQTGFSSANPAVHLAWYLGCTSLLLVGIDGGPTRATVMQAANDRPSPPSYDAMRSSVREQANHFFPDQWQHWEPPRSLAGEGEWWKYQGIYQTQAAGAGYGGYGHSNHGQKALPWVLMQAAEKRFFRVLDVGCGHNEFAFSLRERCIDVVGVDFACPGADVIAPATALPFKDGEFALVTSFDMLEHLPESEVLPALREMRRVAPAFCFSIATAPSRILWQGHNLHPTVQPLTWWQAQIANLGGVFAPNAPEGYVCGRWE